MAIYTGRGLIDDGSVATPTSTYTPSAADQAAAISYAPTITQSAKLTEPDSSPVVTDTNPRNTSPIVSTPVAAAPLSTNQKIANTISSYAQAHPAPAGTHYGQTLGPDGNPILYKNPVVAGGAGAGSGSGTGGTGTGSTTATAVGQAILGSDGWYYQPMSDGTSVKLVQGQSQVNAADTSAINSISDILTQAGLNTLANNAYNQLKAGVPAAQIINDIRNSQDYANRFPGMAALAARGQRITEADYINKEKADIELLKQYNIPAGIFDTTAYLGKLISNNVTAPDLQMRLQAAQDSVNSLDPNIIKYAQDTYGLNAGSLAAWALDPAASTQVIQQQAKAMQIGGAALQAGFNGGLASNGELSTTQAQQLANAGVNQAQAQAGFNTLGQEGQFAQALPGDTTGSVTNQQLINAQFGLNSQDTLAVKKLQQARVNEFNQGGAVASNATGITGLGKGNATA